MEKIVTITYLELRRGDPEGVARPIPEGFDLVRMGTPQPAVNRFLYTAVGGDWYWIDQLDRPLSWWRDRVETPGFETWLLMADGAIAGYFELEPHGPGTVEIAYFGLLPPFVERRGLGGPLLCEAIRRAWEIGAERITVETCSMDHPGALANYRKRGFLVVETRSSPRVFDEAPPGPWPGARHDA